MMLRTTRSIWRFPDGARDCGKAWVLRNRPLQVARAKRALYGWAFFSWMACIHAAVTHTNGAFHVFPGDDIQSAIEMAADHTSTKSVVVHAGEYRPDSKRQAMIWLNKRHDGVRVSAAGIVTLTAANPQLSKPTDAGHPAVVNHVVYFGDGISSNTSLMGFRITGANHFVTRENTPRFEPNKTIPRNYFFYSDGGAVKVFGRSYPVLSHLEIDDNFTSPCGAGISVQHQGYSHDFVRIENCIFRRNRAQGTGAAVDLLAGSYARIFNCLFVGNVSNTGEDPVARNSGERPFVNNGVLTIFWKSRAEVLRCTFAGNRNGVDDMGGASTYEDCIFHDNNLDTGLRGFGRYSLAVNAGATVNGCFLQGAIHDIKKVISPQSNQLNPSDPKFDREFVPTAQEYSKAGYRPSKR